MRFTQEKQQKTFYADESVWKEFLALCREMGMSMNSRINQLVERDLASRDQTVTTYRKVDKKLKKQFEALCRVAGVSPLERLEELLTKECKRMIGSEVK